jgi:Fic family protein
MNDDRRSEADEPVLITDPVELARHEAANALDQYDEGMAELERWLAGKPRLKVSLVLSLHRLALDGINRYAGNFRPAGVAIRGSRHKPVAPADVPRYVEEMLQYVEDNWSRRTAIHLASYVLWRLNWIHPFSDGNGRTARILSYMVLCGRLGTRLPGTNTIPEQIAANKKPYYDALEKRG